MIKYTTLSAKTSFTIPGNLQNQFEFMQNCRRLNFPLPLLQQITSAESYTFFANLNALLERAITERDLSFFKTEAEATADFLQMHFTTTITDAARRFEIATLATQTLKKMREHSSLPDNAKELITNLFISRTENSEQFPESCQQFPMAVSALLASRDHKDPFASLIRLSFEMAQVRPYNCHTAFSRKFRQFHRILHDINLDQLFFSYLSSLSCFLTPTPEAIPIIATLCSIAKAQEAMI